MVRTAPKPCSSLHGTGTPLLLSALKGRGQVLLRRVLVASSGTLVGGPAACPAAWQRLARVWEEEEG